MLLGRNLSRCCLAEIYPSSSRNLSRLVDFGRNLSVSSRTRIPSKVNHHVMRTIITSRERCFSHNRRMFTSGVRNKSHLQYGVRNHATNATRMPVLTPKVISQNPSSPLGIGSTRTTLNLSNSSRTINIINGAVWVRWALVVIPASGRRSSFLLLNVYIFFH